MRDIEDVQIEYYEHGGYVYLHEPITNFIWGPYKSKQEADEHIEEFIEHLIVEGGSMLNLW